MKRVFSLMLVLIFGIGLLQAKDSKDDYYFKVNKSFEIFGAVFRELADNYVIEVDPEDLVTEGINGMLNTLDPYTVYLDENENDEIDFLTTGSYVGLGITVGMRDSMLTIVGIHEGFPAQKNGIRIGDKIYKVDTAVVLRDGLDDLRKYTKGDPGTKVDVWVLRGMNNDTLKFTIPREEIKVNNVSYYGVVDDSVAYIKLDRFSRLSGEEVRSAINNMRRKSDIKGIILDLRDNPGGLLEAAVSISEIFVPNNSIIVKTMGRKKEDYRVYRSLVKPVEPNVPLAVLINEYSASASEIVAGAIQDLDRGIIVGEKSYGKGLVQSVFDLPYKGNLKVTTAKYYTPSGRSIHKVENQKGTKRLFTGMTVDTLYSTLHGRKVIDAKGIIPDSLVPDEVYPDFIVDLVKNNMIFNFATNYSAKFQSLPPNFKVDDKVLREFSDYLKSKDYAFKSTLDKNIEDLKKVATTEHLSPKLQKDITDLKLKIQKEEKDPVAKYANDLKPFLETEILRRFLSENEVMARNLRKDKYISTAVSLLEPDKYIPMLSGGTEKGQDSSDNTK